MHRRLLLTGALLLACTAPVSQSTSRVVRREGDAPVYELRNGRWFDGTRFVTGTRYTARGVLTARRPATIDSVIDLAGGWVIPALGEAHNHNAVPSDTGISRRYLSAGVYYVQNPDNLPVDRTGAPGVFGTPRSIDVTFANGGVTGPGGHPTGLVRRNIARGSWRPEDGEGAFIHTVATRAELERAWTVLRASSPDFVKAYLLFSEEYAARLADSTTFDWRGMDPALLPRLIALAHADGRRVMVHVETAADFRTAVAAGADQIGHLPGFRPAGRTLRDWFPLARYRLAAADAREAARRDVAVVTTVSEALELLDGMIRPGGPTADSAAAVRRMIVENLNVLHVSGVRLLIGSDRYRATSAPEAMALRGTGVFSDLELLRLWAVETPKAIFPRRRVGTLGTGDEASFLVLAGDPTADLTSTGRITLRVKQGWIVR